MSNRGQGQTLGNTKHNRQQQHNSLKGKSNTDEPPLKNKRTHSDVSEESNSSMIGLSIIQTQLDEMNESLSEVKKNLEQVLKKEDIEALIKSTVCNIMDKLEKKMREDIENKVQEKTKHLNEKIDSISFENQQLTDQLKSTSTTLQKQINDLEEQIQHNEKRSKDALKNSNYNEQYSRKNNVKIMDVPEDEGESNSNLLTKVCDIFATQNVELAKNEIIALHRIPTRKGGIRPVLMKTMNNNVKSRLMKKRKEMKKIGHRLVDDVTSANTGLINRLQLHSDIESAWYFNGSVYGMTHTKNRIKFDLYDNINEVIAASKAHSNSGRR